MHSHPCALHQSRYTLRTFGRIPVTGNLRNPCFCAASKRIRSFCVSRWPMLRLPIFARVGMPRLSRSTSSLFGRVIVQIVTSYAAPLKSNDRQTWIQKLGSSGICIDDGVTYQKNYFRTLTPLPCKQDFAFLDSGFRRGGREICRSKRETYQSEAEQVLSPLIRFLCKKQPFLCSQYPFLTL